MAEYIDKLKPCPFCGSKAKTVTIYMGNGC